MYILFDIGGTKTRIAASEHLTYFKEPVKFDTPKTYADGIAKLIKEMTALVDGAEVTAIAGGIRGPLNKTKTRIVSDDVLSDWVDKPLLRDLEKAFDAPVSLENDAALAGLGEAHCGAGKGSDIVAYMTVSTGVGGARIVNGKIDVASNGFEPGHQSVDADQTICASCATNSLQDMVSGTAVEQRFGKKAYEISQDDPLWDELAQWLAYGLKNTILYWSPDVIVLGGSMIIGDPRIKREDIARHTLHVLGAGVPCPPILDAVLGDNAGLYGAMMRITQMKKKKGKGKKT